LPHLMKDPTNALAPCARGRLIVAAAVAVASACSPPPPRSYDFFLLDSIARDGAIARCDLDPVAAQTDIECANARRAALAVQLDEERARRAVLERESAARIEALRREYEAQRARAAAAEAALGPGGADAWSSIPGDDSTIGSVPADGAAPASAETAPSSGAATSLGAGASAR